MVENVESLGGQATLNHDGPVEGVELQVEDSLVRVFEYKGNWVLATRKYFVNEKERSRILTALRSHLNIEVI